MATIKFHFRPSRRGADNREGRLFVRLIHRRCTKEIATGLGIYACEWDGAGQSVLLPDSIDNLRCTYLLDLSDKLSAIRGRIVQLAARLEQKGGYTTGELAAAFRAPDYRDNSLCRFSAELEEELHQGNQPRTARAYRGSVKKLLACAGCPDLSLEDISASLVKNFETRMKESGLQPNTISFYMRNLRAIYHKAVNRQLISERQDKPFARVYTSVAPTCKRALCEEEMQQLVRLEEKMRNGSSPQREGSKERNEAVYESLLLFLFSFHARGMSFVDVCYLRKEFIKEDTIRYHRKKTGGMLAVVITKPMRAILDYFAGKAGNSPYLFPLLRGKSTVRDRLDYENALGRQNRLLKEAGRMAGLERLLTTHMRRHRESFNYVCSSVLQS